LMTHKQQLVFEHPELLLVVFTCVLSIGHDP